MSKPNKQKQEKDAFKRYMLDTIRQIDTSQVKDEKLGEDSVQEPSEDIDPSEFTSGTDAPSDQGKNPTPEDTSTRSKRFSIEHEETTTKDSLLLKEIKKKTDKPSD